MFISSGPFKISDGASVDFSGNSSVLDHLIQLKS